MANQLTTIVNQLISLIKTNYPRFKDPGRIEFSQELEFENLGYDDNIVITPEPSVTAINLTSGKIANYLINLRYFKKLYKDQLTGLSDFAESLDSYLLTHRHEDGYWTHLDTEVNYEIDIPEKYEGKLTGFEMLITFITYKSA